jgi:poly(A) polymerase
MMLEGLPAGCQPTLAWGVLLHDVGKPPTFTPPSGPTGRIRFDGHAEVGTVMAEAICHRLRFSGDDTAQIAALIAHHLRFKDVAQMKPSTLKRFVRLDRFDEHMELHRLDCSSSHGHLDNYELVRKFLAETPPGVVRPPRLITGDDLIALGLKPGRPFRELLEVVEEAQLNGKIGSKEEALKLVRESIGPSS